MKENRYHHLFEKAKDVLYKNWMIKYTSPAKTLYPYQWSWDSGFIAIGLSYYDQEKAQNEMLNLFKGQWENGMLPHIVYHCDFENYFPDPDYWMTYLNPNAPEIKTSGIIQQPIHATACLQIYKNAKDKQKAKEFLKQVFPKLKKWHEFLYRERSPDNDGLICIVHPWESGTDNIPVWDDIYKRIQVEKEKLPNYKRKDIETICQHLRPSDDDYDMYIYLIELFKDLRYDQKRILENSPFVVQGPLLNAILAQSNLDLAKIADIIGEHSDIFIDLYSLTKNAMNQKLLNCDEHIYLYYDYKAKKHISTHVSAGFVPFYGKIPPPEEAKCLYDYMNSQSFCQLGESCYAVVSYDKTKEDFSPHQYWRGPIWININWLIYKGLKNYYFEEYSKHIANSIIELVEKYGFYEYFDLNGKGYGAKDFSWTASLLIDVLFEENLLK